MSWSHAIKQQYRLEHHGLNSQLRRKTVDAKTPKAVELGYIFKYDERDGVVCKFCAEAKSSCNFATGKVWDQWKIDYLKRHLLQKVHLESISKLKRKKKEVESTVCRLNQLPIVRCVLN